MNLAQCRVQIHRPRRPISTLAGHALSLSEDCGCKQDKRPPVGIGGEAREGGKERHLRINSSAGAGYCEGIEVGFLGWGLRGVLGF